MQITLVAIHPSLSPQSLPLANAFLAATLLNSADLKGKVTVTLLDLYSEQSVADCAAAVAATKPDMIGFSVYLWNREQSAAIARELRPRGETPFLFCGGPEATADPGGLLSAAPFDFLIAGEGELPLLNITRLILGGKDFSATPGCVVRQEGKLLLTPPLPVTDLDTIPSPFLAGILPAGDYQGFLWQLSRGCCFDCDFCFDAKEQQGVRRFGKERIVAELAWLAGNGVAQVFVLDSTFNQNRKAAAEILKLIAKQAPQIHFHFEVRSEFIDRQQAGLFAKITCSLQIGLQSSNPLVLKGVNRSFNRDDFVYRIGLLNEAGAIFGFDLIYGLPGDTLDGFRKSLQFALSLLPNHLDIFPLAILPGTKLALKSGPLGLRHLPHPPYTLLETASFPATDMAVAQKLATACDIFYSRGKAVAWFATITASLGVSGSALLEEFAAYLDSVARAPIDEASLADAHIWQLQRAFLQRSFAGRNAADLLPIALDLVDYNYHYAAALMAVPPTPPNDRELQRLPLLKLPLRTAESACLAKFNFEILEILETGVPDLAEFTATYSPTGSFAVIYPLQGEVWTESLIEPYYRLLELLDGSTPSGELAAKLDIPAAEALSFLEFAIAEGVVVLPVDAATGSRP